MIYRVSYLLNGQRRFEEFDSFEFAMKVFFDARTSFPLRDVWFQCVSNPSEGSDK